jgi:hypothetical protein
MSIQRQQFYPGGSATPRQILDLADEYRRAADALLRTGRPGRPLSRAPYRLVAIHAVELYLNAFLLAAGHPAAKLRGLQHDLAARTGFALDAGLPLRKRTAEHLCRLSETREYVVIRYDPATPAGSALNRLAATLTEVAEKVLGLIDRSAVPKAKSSPGAAHLRAA